MFKRNYQEGMIPLFLLGIIVAVLMGVSIFIIFSSGGITQSVTPSPTAKAEPTATPNKRSNGGIQLVKVDITIDIGKTRTVYCDSQFAENIQQESDQFGLELEKSQECVDNYELDSTDKRGKLKICSAKCEASHSAEIKKCNQDFDNGYISDYDYRPCVDDSTTIYNSCLDQCGDNFRVKLRGEYNRDCQNPAVDQGFRVDDLLKQYCQNNPN